ncbi:hypothetical protein AB0L13_22010 [Saccharopolyspora shandongensis]|uniref:hypothetical protein n=1 Tax=Saccharopolyspora shandongensis TaxID=418495 RepID=UPI00343A64BF
MLDRFRESLGMPLSGGVRVSAAGRATVIAYDLRHASPLVDALLVFVPIAA